MNNGKDNTALETGIDFEFPPIKKEGRYLNSLVIKCIISLSLSWWTMSSTDQEIQELIDEAGLMIMIPMLFIAYLVMVSIAESVVLLFIDAFKGLLKYFERTSRQS